MDEDVEVLLLNIFGLFVSILICILFISLHLGGCKFIKDTGQCEIPYKPAMPYNFIYFNFVFPLIFLILIIINIKDLIKPKKKNEQDIPVRSMGKVE
jgi:TRAP-type C4-dicarboxylate transport system permease small subunit